MKPVILTEDEAKYALLNLITSASNRNAKRAQAKAIEVHDSHEALRNELGAARKRILDLEVDLKSEREFWQEVRIETRKKAV